MRTEIGDAVFPNEDSLITECSDRTLMFLIGKNRNAMTNVAIGLDGAKQLADVLIQFIRNHPEARR
jgi:hypothetical protein